MVAERFVTLLQDYGVLDFLLPFILVFTIVFAVLEKSHILGNKKNFNVIIAFCHQVSLSYILQIIKHSFNISFLRHKL